MRIASLRLVKFGAIAALGLALSGCMTATVYEAAPEANLKPRDKEQFAKARFAKPVIPEPFRRAIVDYHRKEAPGTIVVDSDNHYLYYVMENGKAIRYGVTVGEEALAFSGVAKVGNMQEWPRWTPTADIHKRLAGLPAQVPGGIDNPLGARALYLFQGSKDTLFRIHGTNQPEYIGEFDLVGLHPHDQRRRHRPFQPRQDRRRCGRAGAQAGRLADQSEACDAGRLRRSRPIGIRDFRFEAVSSQTAISDPAGAAEPDNWTGKNPAPRHRSRVFLFLGSASCPGIAV